MQVKPGTCIRQAAAIFAFAIVYTSVAAQVNATPSKLSGRWTTLDGAYSQSISANIDVATSKGEITVWSNQSGCTIRDAPIAVTSTGEKLIFKVDSSYSNPCRSNVLVELTKKAGTDDYEGELRQDGTAFPILRVKMSP
jgi:hypothetical protein